MFWGVAFITVGLAMILSYVFKIDLPVVKIMISFFFIYMGFKILLGSFNIEFAPKITDSAAVFGTGHFTWDGFEEQSNVRVSESLNEKKYDVVFGKGDIDLTDIKVTDKNVRVKIDNVFSETTLRIRKGTPYEIQTKTVFSAATLPNKNSNTFGKMNYDSDEESEYKLLIDADVVFGKLTVLEE